MDHVSGMETVSTKCSLTSGFLGNKGRSKTQSFDSESRKEKPGT